MTKCPECGNDLAETIEAIRIPMSSEKNAFLQTIRAKANYMKCVKGCEAEYFRIQTNDDCETLIRIPPEPINEAKQ